MVEFGDGEVVRAVYLIAGTDRIAVKYTEISSPQKVLVGIWEYVFPDNKAQQEER
ncbi:hypothetical protein D3C71_2241050 [compost metagenome]